MASIVGSLLGGITRRIKNVGRRTRRVGRNSLRLAGRVTKPLTNLAGLTGRRRNSSRRSRK